MVDIDQKKKSIWSILKKRNRVCNIYAHVMIIRNFEDMYLIFNFKKSLAAEVLTHSYLLI